MDMDLRRSALLVLAAGSLAVTLAGCTADGLPPQTAPSPSESASGPQATPPGSPQTARPPDVPVPPMPPPPGSNGKRVALERSGGFAGAFETLQMQPDGRWLYTGGRGSKGGGKPTTGQLTVAQFNQLQTLVNDPKLVKEAAIKRGPADCKDGFNYALSTGDLTISWQSCSPADEPPTAAAIVRLLTGATPL